MDKSTYVGNDPAYDNGSQYVTRETNRSPENPPVKCQDRNLSETDDESVKKFFREKISAKGDRELLSEIIIAATEPCGMLH